MSSTNKRSLNGGDSSNKRLRSDDDKSNTENIIIDNNKLNEFKRDINDVVHPFCVKDRNVKLHINLIDMAPTIINEMKKDFAGNWVYPTLDNMGLTNRHLHLINLIIMGKTLYGCGDLVHSCDLLLYKFLHKYNITTTEENYELLAGLVMFEPDGENKMHVFDVSYLPADDLLCDYIIDYLLSVCVERTWKHGVKWRYLDMLHKLNNEKLQIRILEEFIKKSTPNNDIRQQINQRLNKS